MPRSKRNKQIELAKTKKRGLEWKKRLFEEVRSCVDKYENVFIFSVNDMRNNKMKNVREQWKHSRFFIGKNKIMAMALGRFAEEEYKPNLHKVGQQIKGQRGLLFSNKAVEEVLSWFRSYSEGDYARSGNTATETVHLSAGPLKMFPHNLEPYLRELGLPTTLEKGVIHLIKDHEVCKVGDILTPESAKILKLLGYEMAEFHITIDCVWSKDGTFLQLTDNVDTDTKENNNKQKKKSSLSSEIIKQKNVSEDEQMEVEENAEENSDSDDVDNEEINEIKNHVSHTTLDVESVSKNISSSTPKIKNSDIKENKLSNLNEKDIRTSLECNMEEMEKISDENNIEEIDDRNDIEKINNDENDIEVITEKTGSKDDIKEISEEMDNRNNVEVLPEKTDMPVIEEIAHEKNDNISNKNEEKTPAKIRKSRVSTKTPKITKKENISKRESLVKTPDANTSQDSPIFRELRNRSVKCSTKKKNKRR